MAKGLMTKSINLCFTRLASPAKDFNEFATLDFMPAQLADARKAPLIPAHQRTKSTSVRRKKSFIALCGRVYNLVPSGFRRTLTNNKTRMCKEGSHAAHIWNARNTGKKCLFEFLIRVGGSYRASQTDTITEVSINRRHLRSLTNKQYQRFL